MSLRNTVLLKPLRLVAVALLSVLSTLTAAQGIDESQLLPVDEAFRVEAEAVSRGWIEFHFKVAPGYYLYRERIKITPVDASFKFNPLHTPPGEFKEDPNFGRMEVYHNDFTAKLTGAAADGVSSVVFKLSYQGCADIGICYPPQRVQMTVALPAADASGTAPAGSDSGMADALGAAPPNTLFPGAGAQPALLGSGSASITSGATDALPLPPEQAFVFEAIAGSPDELLLRFSMPPGYYLYRDHSTFALSDAAVGTLGVPRWPEARTIDDPEFGPVPVFFDLVEVPLTLARGSPAAQHIDLIAKFQGCEDGGVCYPPMTRLVPIELPASSTESLRLAAATVERELARAVAASVDKQSLGKAGIETTTFWGALLLALLGGLILNLMPCVLPVLSLKALSLAETSESPQSARHHALWYTAGVMSSFAIVGLVVIGLSSGGKMLGWGVQLQQPVIVALLAYVMVVLGLSLSGVITLGAGLSNLGGNLAGASGAKGDFFTGVLAVVVASPCTAPFMSTALAFAFAQPAWIALMVFLVMGLGLALPFLIIGFVPGLAHRLPKPGAWMETLKQILAFPLYLTAVWLAWVLGQQRGADAMALWMAGALALAAGLWWWERGRYAEARVSRLLVTIVLVALSIFAVYSIHQLRASSRVAATAGISAPYSADALARLRAEGKPVLVNMTADWCLSCKVNERTTLGTDAFVELLKSTGTVYLKGDWTNEDPEITDFLTAHQSVGVPLYVYFPADGGPAEKLPAVLTPKMIAETLR